MSERMPLSHERPEQEKQPDLSIEDLIRHYKLGSIDSHEFNARKEDFMQPKLNEIKHAYQMGFFDKHEYNLRVEQLKQSINQQISQLISSVAVENVNHDVAESAAQEVIENNNTISEVENDVITKVKNDDISNAQELLGMKSPPEKIIAKLTNKFDEEFNDVAGKKQQIPVSEYSEYVILLTDTLDNLKEAAYAEANSIIDDSVRKSTFDQIKNEVTDRMEKIGTLLDMEVFYDEQLSAEDAEAAVDEVIEDDASSPEQKRHKLLELALTNPNVKKIFKKIGAIAASVMIFMASTGFSLGDNNAEADNSINSNTVGVEHNFQGNSESFAEYLKGYEQGFSFEKHKEGDPIVFDVEVYKKLQEERTAPNAHMAFGPSLEKLLQERNMEYTPENVLKSFLENAYHNPKIVIGHFMDREVVIDGNVIKVTNDNADEIFAKMKNDAGFYGKIYDAFLKEVNKDGNIVKFGHAKTNEPSIYSVLDAHGRTHFGTSFNYNGDSDTIIIVDKDGNAIGEYRIKCSGQKTGITRTIIPNVEEDSTFDHETELEPEPEPEPTPPEETPSDDDLIPPIPNTPDTGTPREDTPTSPVTPKPEEPTTLEAKDRTKDINANEHIEEQIKKGGQRVDDGGHREPDQSQAESENTQENLIKQEQQKLDKQKEMLNESYEALSPEEKATVTENETGVDEVDKPYDEAAKKAEVVNNQVENDEDDENDGMVSPI